MQNTLALAFVDFDKASDSLFPRAIIEALTTQCVYKPYIDPLVIMYQEAKARLLIYKESPEFPTKREIRKCDAISFKLFTASVEDTCR